MNITDAVREAMRNREESHALSLMDVQNLIRVRYAIVSTDSSIGRRLREMDAKCKRCSDGVFRYWTAERPAGTQGELLAIPAQHYREDAR